MVHHHVILVQMGLVLLMHLHWNLLLLTMEVQKALVGIHLLIVNILRQLLLLLVRWYSLPIELVLLHLMHFILIIINSVLVLLI